MCRKRTLSGAFHFKQRASALSDPQVMLEFRRQLSNLHLSKPERGHVERSLNYAFPDSFNRASEMLRQAAEQMKANAEPLGNVFLDLFQQAGPLGPAFLSLNQQAGPLASTLPEVNHQAGLLPSAFSRMGDAANLFARRTNSLRIEVQPVMVPYAVPQGQPGGQPQATTQGAPQSAIGSVVERDGMAKLHRGNVIFPASLSRRRPGDWLEDARSFRRAPEPRRTMVNLSSGQSLASFRTTVIEPRRAMAERTPTNSLPPLGRTSEPRRIALDVSPGQISASFNVTISEPRRARPERERTPSVALSSLRTAAVEPRPRQSTAATARPVATPSRAGRDEREGRTQVVRVHDGPRHFHIHVPAGSGAANDPRLFAEFIEHERRVLKERI